MLSLFERNLVVSAYCRVSTDKYDQINSFDSQVSFFTGFIAKNKNWTLGQIYFDEGISGTSTKKRLGFNKMISDATQGKFNLILTKEVSRFARNTVDTLTYTRLLKELGIGVLFVIDNIFTLDKDGELRLTIMASLAQEESRKTSERVKWGQTRKMEQGVVFGRDLLGYSVKNGSLIVNQHEAEIVKLIFHMYTTLGMGTLAIARELTAAGFKPKYSNKWSNSSILKILRNEKYVGDLCQKKTRTTDYLTHKKIQNTKLNSKIYLDNHHQPIIDRDTWNATQSELARRSPTLSQKSKYSSRYWCSGKVFCESCGKTFVPKTKKLKNGEIYRAWRCSAAANHGIKKLDTVGNTVGCNSGSVNNNVLLKVASCALKYAQVNTTIIAKQLSNKIHAYLTSLAPSDTTSIAAKLEKLLEMKKRTIDIYIEGIISHEELKKQTAAHDKEIQRLNDQLAKSQAPVNQQENLSERMNSITSEINKILNFDTTSQLLLAEHLEKILVHKDKSISVYLKNFPRTITITYKTSGRLNSFKTKIESIILKNK